MRPPAAADHGGATRPPWPGRPARDGRRAARPPSPALPWFPPPRLLSASTTSTARSGAWSASTSRCACGEKPSVSPGCGARFSATIRRARVPSSARASSGTSRCGSTLVNHEPGPSTTQSAAPIACTASGQAGGSAGISDTDRTRPGVVAQATWPRTGADLVRPVRICALNLGHQVQRDRRHRQHPAVRAEQPGHPVQALDRVAEQLPERHDQDVADRVAAQLRLAGEPVLDHPAPGGAPGVVAAQRGQRHPQVAGRQHAELPAQPAAGAAVVGHRDHRGQVPGHPAQRRQRGVQAVPAAQRHHPAAGRPPGDRRDRMGDLGARMTVLARHRPTRARGRGATPGCPATTPTAARRSPRPSTTLRCLPPVQPTASGDEVTARPVVAGQRDPHRPDVGVQEVGRARLAEHVVADRPVLAGQRGQLGDPVRVGQEPAVRHHVGVDRQAVLEAERDHRHPQAGLALGGERAPHPRPQLVHVQRGGVQHQVGLGAQGLEQLALGGDAVHDPAALLERVRPGHAVEPAHQRLVGGLQEDHVRPHAAGVQVADRRLEVGRERPAAHVDHRGQPRHRALGPPGQVDHGRQQVGRHVVGDEPVQVLQRLGRRAAPGPGQAGDDDDLGRSLVRGHALPPWVMSVPPCMASCVAP